MNSLATDSEVLKLQRVGYERPDIQTEYHEPTRMLKRALLLCSMWILTIVSTGCYAYGGHALASNDVELRAHACEAHTRNDRRAYGTLRGRLKDQSATEKDLCGAAITVERTCTTDCDHE